MTPLALLLLAGPVGPGSVQPTNEGYYMQPAIHGDTIVFVSQGEIWTVGIHGGLAHALTSDVAPASSPAISPDGQIIAFTGSYEGPRDAYVMSVDGGLPIRLTYGEGMNVVGWGSHGVLGESSSRATLPNGELFNIDPETKQETPVPLAQAADGTYDGTGRTLFFTRQQFQGSHTKRYQGGTAQNIWKYTDGAPEAIPLTKSYPGTSKNPMWWNGRIYFLTDREGTMNLWSMDPSGGNIKQLTHHAGWDIQSASLDSGRVAYQLGPDIWVYEIESGKDSMVPIGLASDFDQTRERWVNNPMQYVSSSSFAADGTKIALTARGQVFVAPAEPGRFIEVSHKPGVRYRESLFTPDGKSVLAVSDQSGETEWWRFPANGVGPSERITSGTSDLIMGGAISPDGKLLAYGDKNQDLYLCDMATKQSKKVASCPDGEFSGFAWSPDSQFLAYEMPTETFQRIVIYSVQTGKNSLVTTDRADSASPAWSPNGKWLYFLSNRTFQSKVGSPWGSRQPEPYFDNESKIYQLALVKAQRSPFQAPDELYEPPAEKPANPVKVTIDFDGIQNRLWEVPVPAGDYANLSANEGRLFFQSSGSNLNYVEVKDRDVSLKTLVNGIQGYVLSQDGKKIAVRRGNSMYVIGSGESPGASLDHAVDTSGWSLTIQPREEWRQMFREAWRLERDYFYDRKLHSVDWNAVYARYAPAVDRVRDRSELSDLIAQMVGELSALHTFVYGGDMRHPDEALFPASLGAALTRDAASGGYRIDKIYRGDPDYPSEVGPLARPGVDCSVGDVVISVNGVDVLTVPDIGSLLRNQAGKQVLLGIKDASGKERQVITEPIDMGAAQDLRYSDWEQSRRQTVEDEGKGAIGYVHLRAMGPGDIARWERDFYPVYNRSGLIIDVRHNGGGNIDSWIIEKLMRKAWFYWQPRIGNPYWNMQYAFRGHVVVLCDEHTASDGEAFTEGIKRLKLGTVIGTRTWGGEIWLSSDNWLVDEGIATAAEYGVYGPEGKWLIEGHGVDPDIVVDDLPHETYEGKDAQLRAAIDYLQKDIAEHPVPVPPAPPYPNKAFPRGH